MKWTIEDLKKVNLPHNYDGTIKVSDPKNSNSHPKDKISVEKETIKKLLWVLHREEIIPDYVEELIFHKVRKFRFDWAIPSLKIAIEYEGVFSKKSRHTTSKGYTTDCDKYNLAVIDGWMVLRYTAKNYEQLGADLKALKLNLCAKKNL